MNLFIVEVRPVKVISSEPVTKQIHISNPYD